MKLVNLVLVLTILSMSPLLAQAEIYKWKDKDGSIRYTDTPPPSNIKQEAIGSKKATKTPASPTAKRLRTKIFRDRAEPVNAFAMPNIDQIIRATANPSLVPILSMNHPAKIEVKAYTPKKKDVK